MQNSGSQSFNAVSWAVKFPTTICVFLRTAVRTEDRSPLVSNLTFNYFLIFGNENQIAAPRQCLDFFQHTTNAFRQQKSASVNRSINEIMAYALVEYFRASGTLKLETFRKE